MEATGTAAYIGRYFSLQGTIHNSPLCGSGRAKRNQLIDETFVAYWAENEIVPPVCGHCGTPA